MAKLKLTMRNSLTIVLAFLGSLISPNVFSQEAVDNTEDKAKAKAAGKAAKDSASGSLSAGAIAAAVAAAAAIAVVMDSNDGGVVLFDEFCVWYTKKVFPEREIADCTSQFVKKRPHLRNTML